jgi:hypothetical protein
MFRLATSSRRPASEAIEVLPVRPYGPNPQRLVVSWEGMCSVTAVRLDSSTPRDPQRPETAGQPLYGAPRRNRTGDPILTIDARVVHKPMQHPTSQHNHTGKRRCRGLGSWGGARLRVAQFLANLWHGLRSRLDRRPAATFLARPGGRGRRPATRSAGRWPAESGRPPSRGRRRPGSRRVARR